MQTKLSPEQQYLKLIADTPDEAFILGQLYAQSPNRITKTSGDRVELLAVGISVATLIELATRSNRP